jgi:hypothetical protein
MKEQEQERPHTITKMGLIVNFDAGVVTGFTGITARIDETSETARIDETSEPTCGSSCRSCAGS